MRLLRLARLSAQLAVRNVGLYAGCVFTIAATAFIASVQVALAVTFADPARVRVGYLGPAEVASQLTAIRGLLVLMSGLAVVIAGFLMFSSVRQVVSFRQRELAMMRLAGGSRTQIALMVFLECLALGLAASVPAALLGGSLEKPAFAALQVFGLFGGDVDIVAGFKPFVALSVAVVVAATAGITGLLAARSATRGDLVSAISTVVKRLSVSQVLWRLLLVAGSLTAIVFLGPQTAGPSVILLVPLLAVVPLIALAPLLVPAVAWLVGRLLAFVFPGSAMLAAQRAAMDRYRFVSTATPIILAVGLLGGFFVANAPDEQMRSEAYRSRLAATTVATVPDPDSADRLAGLLNEAGSRPARFSYANRSVSGSLRTLYFTDPVVFARLLSQSVETGNPAQVREDSVASSLTGARIGDTYTLRDTAGRERHLTVVAVVNDSLFEGIFLDWVQLKQVVGRASNLPSTVFTDGPANPRIVRTLMAENSVDGSVVDASGYIKQRLEVRRANTSRSNISLFGTIYLMSLISLIQTVISSNIARRREYSMLRSLGLGRGAVVRAVTVESAILLAVSGILIFASLVVLGLRFTPGGASSGAEAILAVIPQTLSAFGTLGAILLAANAAGAWLTTTDPASQNGRLQ